MAQRQPHTHTLEAPPARVKSDPIRFDGPYGSGQPCLQKDPEPCQLDYYGPGFSIPTETVLLVGEDIAPGWWKIECKGDYRGEKYWAWNEVAILTEDIRIHPAYPGRGLWEHWEFHLVNFRLSENAPGYRLFTSPFDHTIEPSVTSITGSAPKKGDDPETLTFELKPDDFAMIFSFNGWQPCRWKKVIGRQPAAD